MPELYHTILEPLFTEKSSAAHATRLEYTFRVHPEASKQQIREVIERLWEVTVTRVRTMQMRSKRRTRGRTVGRSARWKKAIVTLRAGDSIDIYEG